MPHYEALLNNKISPVLKKLAAAFFILFFTLNLQSQVLKSIVYDFDGLDIGATDLPEGDYVSGDMVAAVAAVPFGPNDMLGDRCMQLNLNWNTGMGFFGRGIMRYVEFDPNVDQFHFFIYNTYSNNQAANIEVEITDDDNLNKIYEGNADDSWKKSLTVPGSGGWQLISIPLKDFSDSNPGGNGVMDMAFTNNQGALLSVNIKFTKQGAVGNAVFYIDMLCFTEGGLPQGASVFDLPGKSISDYCMLGAYSDEGKGKYYLTAAKFESLFPKVEGKKIRYVNTFLHWSYGTSTTPDEMPGAGAQTLLNAGYTPVLTWEPMFAGYDRLDPVQPRLQNILNGQYDGYIDAFADEVKKLSDTVIIRLMHEFEGDWYPWSIVHNSNDPQKYINAYRHFVNRFRARGANNVKWMWCVNSDYAPYESFNFIVKAYPGDEYVNIVATDIYNNHYPVALPWWRSFRWQTTESYYYLQKYIPNKPLFICEVGCRERKAEENVASQSKGAWYQRMDRELQSNFHKARALIFFNSNPDQVWVVNSSQSALQSLIDNVWYDDYYFKKVAAPVPSPQAEEEEISDLFVFPNPSDGKVLLGYFGSSEKEDYQLRVVNGSGRTVLLYKEPDSSNSFGIDVDMSSWPKGIYYFELSARNPGESDKRKRMRQIKKISLL